MRKLPLIKHLELLYYNFIDKLNEKIKMKIVQFLFKIKKTESLDNRILFLINRVKGYLNEVGGKYIRSLAILTLRVKGYLNEVGRKQILIQLTQKQGVKGYLNEVGRKPIVIKNSILNGGVKRYLNKVGRKCTTNQLVEN